MIRKTKDLDFVRHLHKITKKCKHFPRIEQCPSFQGLSVLQRNLFLFRINKKNDSINVSNRVMYTMRYRKVFFFQKEVTSKLLIFYTLHGLFYWFLWFYYIIFRVLVILLSDFGQSLAKIAIYRGKRKN